RPACAGYRAWCTRVVTWKILPATEARGQRTQAPGTHAGRTRRSGVFFELGGVIVGAEQLVEFGLVVDLQLEQPAITVRVTVDQFRLVFQCAVYLNDFTGDRRIDIRCGLH